MLHSCWNVCKSKKLVDQDFYSKFSSQFGFDALNTQFWFRFKILITNNMQWYKTPGYVNYFAYLFVRQWLYESWWQSENRFVQSYETINPERCIVSSLGKFEF